MSELPQGFRFGPFLVDLRRRSLFKDGEPVYLTPKSFDVLALLASRRGELVTKEELMDAVWAGVAVESTNLTYHISVVRRALGEVAGQREYILTVPGQGYRFIAGLDEEPAPPALAAVPTDAARTFLVRAWPRWMAVAGAVVTFAALAAGMKIRLAGQSVPWRQLTFDRADDVRPDLSPDGRFVAFTSNRQGRPNIWVMGADGSAPRNLTGDRGDNDHGDNDGAAWSPDGHFIAFNSNRGTVESYIFIMSADGGGQRAVSRTPGSRPAWSPDGRSLLYQSQTNRISLIRRVDLDTGTETVVPCADAGCFDPAWSPDGKSILHTRGTAKGLQLFVMDAQGGNVHQLTRLYARTARLGVWSGDGQRIAFTSQGDHESGIYTMRSDGTEAALLTRSFADAAEPTWSRDGSRIYFQSERRGNSDIYSIEAPAGTGERLTRDVGRDFTPALSPSGREVAFSSNRSGSYDIFAQDLATGRVENLTRNPAEDRDPSWSPDGGSIAFESTRTGRPQIFVLTRNGGAVRRISPDGESWVQPAWSPDGKTVAAASGPEGQARIKLLPVNGGAVVDLAPDYAGAAFPAWSPDGKTITFDSMPQDNPHQGNRRIYAVSAAGGPVRPVTDGVHLSAHSTWRPDGALAFHCECGFGMQIMLLEPGGTPVPVTGTLSENRYPSFSRDGSRIVFATERDGNFEIYQIYR